MRVTVRTTDERDDARSLAVPVPTAPEHEEPGGATEPLGDDMIRIESPMVGTFYRAPQPGAAPFVEEGDTVETGQDSLHPRGDEAPERGQGRVRGRRRRVCVENAASVQYGDLLFELEP